MICTFRSGEMRNAFSGFSSIVLIIILDVPFGSLMFSNFWLVICLPCTLSRITGHSDKRDKVSAETGRGCNGGGGGVSPFPGFRTGLGGAGGGGGGRIFPNCLMNSAFADGVEISNSLLLPFL